MLHQLARTDALRYNLAMTLMMAPGKRADFIIKDIDDDKTYYACPVCDTPADKACESTMSWKNAVYCANQNCYTQGEKTSFSSDTARMIVRNQHNDLAVNPSDATDMAWYHISHIPPEEMEFDSWLSMHVGQAETIKDYYNVSFSHDDDFYIYQLEFVDNTEFYPYIIDDCDDWEDVEISFENHCPIDAYCYINRVEAPGSISVIARRDVLRISQVYNRGEIPNDIHNVML